MRFWDASVVVPLLLDEPRSAEVGAIRQTDPDIVVWWGTRIECWSAISRRVREGLLSGDERAATIELFGHFFSWVTEIQPAEQLRLRAERLLSVHPLRAADALQLAAALIWSDDRTRDIAFVCLDARLREAAVREGFSVCPE
ncbi:MAG TPA: type II toxin-antitoxin system VapC family toxin [Chloroflexota bacterium]|nr:type II toxin-antitoxin system VapC family toxin [Chloroflexota bacterium]